MERTELRKRLIALDQELLADALLAMADRYEGADDFVERLAATKKERAKKFRSKIAGLNRASKFLDLRASNQYARELQHLIVDLVETTEDPEVGLELTVGFLKADKRTLERADDSWGALGDVFKYELSGAFVDFASRISEKRPLVDLVVELVKEDEYYTREPLIERAGEFLDEEALKDLIVAVSQAAQREFDEFSIFRWLKRLEILALQVGDPLLFEKSRMARSSRLLNDDLMEIAEAYLVCGDAESALLWSEKVESPDFRDRNRIDRLLLDVHGILGNPEEQEQAALRIFKTERSMSALAAVTDIVGEDRREELIDGESVEIRKEQRFSTTSARFLLNAGRPFDAEEYVFQRRDQLDGGLYEILPSLAGLFEENEMPLGATLIYRALLVRILADARYKAYGFGARYLKKLDSLADEIEDWREVEQHEEFLESLYETHKRKTSFWAKYDK